MQVVFVHGVNTRASDDGIYEKAVAARNDRLKRLAFGSAATIHNPYWGQFGLPGKQLTCFPESRGAVQSLGMGGAPLLKGDFLTLARQDFGALIASLSVAAIRSAETKSEDERHAVEDYWMAAIAYAEARGKPNWLDNTATEPDFAGRLDAEVAVSFKRRSLGTDWIPRFDFHAKGAAGARKMAAGFLTQFLGDALMFFSRRDKSESVRQEIARHIVTAAKAAKIDDAPLILIGHSMGGSVLHEMLSDANQVTSIEEQLGGKLVVDLFLSVGTQIGLFAELNLFPTRSRDLAATVPIKHFWNVYDYTDTLAYLCEPLIERAVDFEVNTAAGIFASHGAYFENALFFARLKARLKDAEIIN